MLTTCSQYDSLGVLGRFFLVIFNGSNWPDPYSWVLIWLLDINFNALSKLFANFCNMSLPALGVESLKPCCCCFMMSFLPRGIYYGHSEKYNMAIIYIPVSVINIFSFMLEISCKRAARLIIHVIIQHKFSFLRIWYSKSRGATWCLVSDALPFHPSVQPHPLQHVY